MLKPAYTHLVSKIVRFRVAVVMSLCLLMVALAIAVIPITRGQKIGADEASGRPVPPRISSILAPRVLSLPGTLKPVVTTSVGSGVSQVVRGLPLTKPLQGPPWTGDAPLPLHPPHGLPHDARRSTRRAFPGWPLGADHEHTASLRACQLVKMKIS